MLLASRAVADTVKLPLVANVVVKLEPVPDDGLPLAADQVIA